MTNTGLNVTEVHACHCGDAHEDLPELDVRAIPHRVRHGAVFGALESLNPGEAIALVAPHDPKPLLAQLAERMGDRITVTYLQAGPESWRLRLAVH